MIKYFNYFQIDSTEAVQKVLKGEKPTLHSDKKGTRYNICYVSIDNCCLPIYREEVEVKEKKNTVDMQKKSADEEKENESVVSVLYVSVIIIVYVLLDKQ